MMRVIRKIVGGFFLLMAAGFIANTVIPEIESGVVDVVCAGIFLALGLLLLFMKGKSKEEKAEIKEEKAEIKARRREAKEQAKELAKRQVTADHVAGLPLAAFVACTLSFEDAGISVHSSGNTFSLSYDKMTDMAIRTSVEIQKAYVSSIGGAVAGAALFGPLGAIVGGRAQEKQSKTVENYAIFTYLKDGGIDYLSFKLHGQDFYKVLKLMEQYKPRTAQQGNVTEL